MYYDKIHLEVITPSFFGLHLDVDSVIAPGSEGYLGILPNHTFLVTSLVEGKLTVRIGDETWEFQIGEGYMEVSPDETHILTEYLVSDEMDAEEILEWGIKYEESE